MSVLVAADNATCYSASVNDWVCWDYVVDRRSQLADATAEHVYITAIAVAAGFVIALALALIARRFVRMESSILGLTTIIYTIPSLAMFSLLVDATGLTSTTVIVGLALYCLTVLVRNILAGLRAVPEEVRESAIGLGYGRTRLLFKIELPLALPVIMAGLRVATVSTVALTTIGTIVGFGGLGNMLSDAIDLEFKAQILTASLLCVLLAIVFDLLLVGVQRLLTPWSRAGA